MFISWLPAVSGRTGDRLSGRGGKQHRDYTFRGGGSRSSGRYNRRSHCM